MSDWRISRVPVAPSARRVAYSWVRPAVRASSRLAMLTHATVSTRLTAIASSHSELPIEPRTASDVDRTLTEIGR